MIYSEKWYKRRNFIIKYLLYLICMPTIEYVFTNLLMDGTRGLFFGLFIGQLAFTIIILKTKKIHSFFIGIGLALITIFVSFFVMGILRNLLFPETNDLMYLIKPDPKIELILEVVFFGSLCLISILIFELINRLVLKNDN